MGPRAGLDRCGKSHFPPGFDPRTAQPVASRYTDYATRPTLKLYESSIITGSVMTYVYHLRLHEL
jgi:hypothetical protein